jgi:hypothetical protein
MKMAPDDASWRFSSPAVVFWRALSFFDAGWRDVARFVASAPSRDSECCEHANQ